MHFIRYACRINVQAAIWLFGFGFCVLVFFVVLPFYLYWEQIMGFSSWCICDGTTVLRRWGLAHGPKASQRCTCCYLSGKGYLPSYFSHTLTMSSACLQFDSTTWRGFRSLVWHSQRLDLAVALLDTVLLRLPITCFLSPLPQAIYWMVLPCCLI